MGEGRRGKTHKITLFHFKLLITNLSNSSTRNDVDEFFFVMVKVKLSCFFSRLQMPFTIPACHVRLGFVGSHRHDVSTALGSRQVRPMGKPCWLVSQFHPCQNVPSRDPAARALISATGDVRHVATSHRPVANDSESRGIPFAHAPDNLGPIFDAPRSVKNHELRKYVSIPLLFA